MIPLAAASLVALASLAACGESEPTEVGNMADPQAEELADAEPVDLPPMERASNSYRCDDGSVVYVTFYTGDTQVGVRGDRAEPQTILQNEAAAETDAEGDAEAEAPAETGGPITFSGEGQTLVGTGDTITYNGQSCSA
ncbi:MAG: hypothetical protein RLN87_10670 [Parasphingopyxis sp.]|nr:hypothetical protein [uncultured Parasphingopyxis sp.]